jgi:hypothetical protein
MKWVIRFRTRLLRICGAAAVLGLVAFILSMNSEPAYEGRPLSFWLDQFTASQNPAERARAAVAIRQLGTNALPELLAMLGKRDSKARQAVLAVMQRQSIFHVRSAEEYHLLARNGFCVLGGVASPAEPALAKLGQDEDPDISDRATEALGDVRGWMQSL